MNRYFIAFFIASSDNRRMTGNIATKTGGEYLNSVDIRKDIEEEFEEDEARDVVITNIIELSEQDYNDWIK